MTNLEPLTNAYAFFHGTVRAITAMLTDGLIDSERAEMLLVDALEKIDAERDKFWRAPVETR